MLLVKQNRMVPMTTTEIILSLCPAVHGYLDKVAAKDISRFEPIPSGVELDIAGLRPVACRCAGMADAFGWASGAPAPRTSRPRRAYCPWR